MLDFITFTTPQGQRPLHVAQNDPIINILNVPPTSKTKLIGRIPSAISHAWGFDFSFGIVHRTILVLSYFIYGRPGGN